MNGGEGNLEIERSGSSDQIFGGAGNDFIFALDGFIDTINGGAGFDRLVRYDHNGIEEDGVDDTYDSIEAFGPA